MCVCVCGRMPVMTSYTDLGWPEGILRWEGYFNLKRTFVVRGALLSNRYNNK